MKNKEKIEKIFKVIDELPDHGSQLTDLFIIERMNNDVKDIEDKKLQAKLYEFFHNLANEYKERDFEEEAKIEFYCRECHQFLPIDKKSDGFLLPTCKDCEKQEQLEEDDF